MADYNKQSKDSRFSGGRGKPSFGRNKSWGGGRQGDGPVILHKATCAECSKECEVPFRPTDGKPVYCKDCFDRKGGNTGRGRNDSRGGDRFARRDFSPRTQGGLPTESGKGNELVLKQLEAVNSNLERLIKIIEASVLASKPSAVSDSKGGLSAVVKKSLKKKVNKK